jgi:hypothetical protein
METQIMTRIILATSILALTGCTDKACDSAGDCDTGAAGAAGPVATSIDTVNWSCTQSSFDFSIAVNGTAGPSDMYIYQTGSSAPWDEYHTFDPTGSAGDGSWTQFDNSLSIVYPDTTAVVSGQTTLYACGDPAAYPEAAGMEYTLTWRFEVYDAADASAATDCGIWGHDPDDSRASDGASCATYDG